MHHLVLVVGKDREGQLRRYQESNPEVDWFGIGGRYSGRLTSKANATTCKVWGDSTPDFESRVLASLSMSRPHGRGPGVDQLRKFDLAPLDFVPPILIVEGRAYGNPLEALSLGVEKLESNPDYRTYEEFGDGVDQFGALPVKAA
jgi:hypothetical protein